MKKIGLGATPTVKTLSSLICVKVPLSARYIHGRSNLGEFPVYCLP